MSILTKEEILKEIELGNIKINPFRIENLGPASIDLTLWNKFRIFKKINNIVDVTNETNYKEYSELIVSDSILILPGETILGITEEEIILSENICGWLEGRSRFARLGLLVHISASFMQPGIQNHQVLEITNMGKIPLRLHAGTKICQFIFQRTEGKAKYSGIFKSQEEP
ncbi:MAG: dCTP deaminase [Candidatus Woesearchaeota archaeon]